MAEPSQLEPALEELRQAGRFAFDTEFVMEDCYASEVCLIQAATESSVMLIDPLAGVDDADFWALVADEHIEKIVHSGGEDLSLCHQRIGRVPRSVFDVQIAAGLVGLDYPLSLMKLVRATCRARLHKSQTLTDWRRRPLSQAQIGYAADDVAYLPAAYHNLCRRLKKQGRLDWAREEFLRLECPENYQPSKEATVLRLKGAGTLDEQGLAVAAELLKVREAMGRRFNRPPRVLLKDYLIVEIARHRWTSPDGIRDLRGHQLSNAAMQQLSEAVKRGLAAPPETWPQLPTATVDTPEETALIALVTALVRDYCNREDIAYQLAATKSDIRALVHAHTRQASSGPSRLADGWRRETVGRLLDELFSGEKRIGIEPTDRGVRMVVE